MEDDAGLLFQQALYACLFLMIVVLKHSSVLVIFLMASASHSIVFQPHKAGKPLRSSAKVIVMNVYAKLIEKHSPKKSENEITIIVAELTGVSTCSIERMKAEFKLKGAFSTPGKKRPLRAKTQTRLQRYDEFTLTAVRKKVHSFFFRNEIPTANKVMLAINEDDELPTICVRTVRNIMKDLGFKYSKRERISMLIERDDIQEWRRRYIREIRYHRSQGRPIYYTDETWVNFGHTKNIVWQDTTIKSSKDAFLRGLSPGLKAPSGKGQRLIIIHAGNDKGFVGNAYEIFLAKKSTGDYHSEMNGEHYENWFVQKLIPNIEPNSIIVLDNAPYHSVHVESIPTKSTKKSGIQEWLTGKQIPWDSDMLKAELLKLVSNVRSRYEAYRIDRIAQMHGHKVLRLPPYHCELNPIEHVWSQVKGFVATENRSFKAAEVEKLTYEGFNRVTALHWSNYVNHVIKEEDKMWSLDEMLDSHVERLEFSLGESDSTDSSDNNLDGIEPLPSS